jgi:large subunit ribosomal protein L6
MSRVLKPISAPSGVDINVSGQNLVVKGSKGSIEHLVHPEVEIKQDGADISFAPRGSSKGALALVGTTRSLVTNMITGVSDGFEKKLELVGVGYRAQAQGKTLNLTLGFSHPVNYPAPEGITIETPSQTEILVKGIDKQKVGQVAAEIRAYRPPEPYKGKGVKYAGERIIRKEAKKK